MAVARRRICRGPDHAGPRWLLWTEFHVRKWYDEGKTRPAQLQSQCKACQRMNTRILSAKKRGRSEPYGQRKPPLSPEEIARRRRARHAKWRKNRDPAAAERQREYNREYAAAKRREEGRPIRGSRKLRRVTRDGNVVYQPDEASTVDVTPAREFLKDMIGEGTLSDYIHPKHPSRRAAQRILSGEIPSVSLSTLDRVFVALGRVDMFEELYPPNGSKGHQGDS